MNCFQDGLFNKKHHTSLDLTPAVIGRRRRSTDHRYTFRHSNGGSGRGSSGLAPCRRDSRSLLCTLLRIMNMNMNWHMLFYDKCRKCCRLNQNPPTYM